jgi:hypothetical protein
VAVAGIVGVRGGGGGVGQRDAVDVHGRPPARLRHGDRKPRAVGGADGRRGEGSRGGAWAARRGALWWEGGKPKGAPRVAGGRGGGRAATSL